MQLETETPETVRTAVWAQLVSKMAATHATSGMRAFAGPSGIGKSTAIASFVRQYPGNVAVMVERTAGAKAGLVNKAVLRAIRRASGRSHHDEPSGSHALGRALVAALNAWGLHTGYRDSPDLWPRPRRTIVVDEAQTLSVQALEEFRFWNDASSGEHAPLGFVLVGNDKFRVEDDKRKGPSFLSSATHSRMQERTVFTHNDVLDDDIELILYQRGICADDTVNTFLRFCRQSPLNRDLRQLGNKIDAALIAANGAPVTPVHARLALSSK